MVILRFYVILMLVVLDQNNATSKKRMKSTENQQKTIPNQNPKKKIITKHLMGEITEHRCPKNMGKPITFFYTPRKNSSKPTFNQNPGKNTPVSSKYMFDYSSPTNEYESRQVEFGHGRAKSKEWNDEVARKFQKEIKGTCRKRDWTDRFALK